jgi:hypothetical protein
MPKKILYSFLSFLISWTLIFPNDACYAAVSPQIADFLCERGAFFYDHGKFFEALMEFKKALQANSESKTAREFISLIEAKKISPNVSVISSLDAQSAVASFLDDFEARTEQESVVIFQQGPASLPQAASSQKSSLNQIRPIQRVSLPAEPTLLDINRKEVGKDSSVIETSVGERLVLKGDGVSRFLLTNPVMARVSKQSDNDLLVEPQEIGQTYLHIWDSKGLKSFKMIIGPRKMDARIVEEIEERYRLAQLPETFKASYSIQGSTLSTGRGIGDQKRQTQTYSYTSSVLGETPYGNVDFAVQGNRSNTGIYHVSNLRYGLTNGHYDNFKDITLRGFDFSPTINAFGFPTADLRGWMIDAPMFNKSVWYQGFWGAIPGGDFTQTAATSGLDRTRKAWLEGLGVNARVGRFANFKGFYVRSYGPERTLPVLTDETAGFGMAYNLGRFDIGSDMSYDMRKNYSYTARTNLTLPKVRLGLTATEISKNFAPVLGGRTSTGSTSGSLNIEVKPLSNLTITDTFTGNHDKAFFNPDRPTRPNYQSITRALWQADAHTEFETAYTMDDQIGSNSPSVTETKELTIRKKLFFLQKLNTYLNYQNLKSKNYSAPANDFNNNKVRMGVGFRVISELYAFYNKEFNILRNTYTQEGALPTAQESGLNYYSQIGETPFFLTMRVFYRDEQDTESVLSYLSGEDRFESEGELTFRPNPDMESFFKARFTNVWAEKAGVAKHFDVDLSWGLRLLWDTGLRWLPRGSFSGYVFYDVNGDGNKQAREKGLKGVVIQGPDGKTSTTDEKGHYKISGVTGKTATLELKVETLPKGYAPTSSTRREIDVVHAKNKRVDFGFATRTEISGIVFFDKNKNGRFDPGEEPIRNVVLTLDGKTRAVSSTLGEFMFRKISGGEHTIKLDLQTIPIKYIPKVPVVKTLNVIDGTTYTYYVPMQEMEGQEAKENPKK